MPAPSQAADALAGTPGASSSASDPRVGELGARRLDSLLRGEGLLLDLGALRARVRSVVPEFASGFETVYANHTAGSPDCFFDADVRVLGGHGLHRFAHRQVRVEIDGMPIFEPEPAAIALPHFEWAVNFVLAQLNYRHLMLHAGSLEIAGAGLLLVATTGSGKSTLTAALGLRGARILSDEFGVVRLSDLNLLTVAKPAVLKNRSIDVIRAWAPDAAMGPVCVNTRKGSVAHLAISESTVRGRHQPAPPRVVVFPQWTEGASLSIRKIGKAHAFTLLGANSFNYALLGPAGFDGAARLVDRCEFHELEYGSLDDAVPALFELCARQGAGDA